MLGSDSDHLSSSCLQGLVLAWIGLWRREPALTDSARVWRTWFANGKRTKIFQVMFRSILPTRLKFIQQASMRFGDAPVVGLPPTLREWYSWAAQLDTVLPERGSFEWEPLLCAEELTGNALLHATLARSMAECFEQSGVPSETIASFAPLLKWHLGRCEEPCLPPAHGYSWSIEDYLFLRQIALVESLETDLSALRESLSEMAMKLARVKSLVRRDNLLMALPRLESDVKRISDLVNGGKRGCPILAAQLRNHAEGLACRSKDLVSTSDTVLATERARAVECISRVEESCLAVLEPTGSPPADRKTINEPKSPCGSSLAGQLRRVIAGVRDEDVPGAQEFGDRLGEILVALECEDRAKRQPSNHERAIRQCLGCLVTLDELSKGGGVAGWVERSRIELREAVVDEGTYVVMDSEFLGMPVKRFPGRVEVVGFIDSKKYRAGQIAAVQQPGYAVRVGDGELKVLHRARVLVVNLTSESSAS